jgi:hypothetical protein
MTVKLYDALPQTGQFLRTMSSYQTADIKWANKQDAFTVLHESFDVMNQVIRSQKNTSFLQELCVKSQPSLSRTLSELLDKHPNTSTECDRMESYSLIVAAAGRVVLSDAEELLRKPAFQSSSGKYIVARQLSLTVGSALWSTLLREDVQTALRSLDTDIALTAIHHSLFPLRSVLDSIPDEFSSLAFLRQTLPRSLQPVDEAELSMLVGAMIVQKDLLVPLNYAKVCNEFMAAKKAAAAGRANLLFQIICFLIVVLVVSLPKNVAWCMELQDLDDDTCADVAVLSTSMPNLTRYFVTTADCALFSVTHNILTNPLGEGYAQF